MAIIRLDKSQEDIYEKVLVSAGTFSPFQVGV